MGYLHLLASTLSLRAVATVLSHKCDIPSLMKDDQIARDNRRFACQYSVGTSRRIDIVLRSRSPRKCRYSLFAYPLFKCAPKLRGTPQRSLSKLERCNPDALRFFLHSRVPETGTQRRSRSLSRNHCNSETWHALKPSSSKKRD